MFISQPTNSLRGIQWSETPEISPIVTGDLPEVEPAGLEIPDYEVKPEEEFSIASPDSTAPLDADDLTLLP